MECTVECFSEDYKPVVVIKLSQEEISEIQGLLEPNLK